MARLTGSTLRTVRFYEEAGLLTPAARSDGGHRIFDGQQRAKLQLILDLREAGLSLSDIKQLFELKNTVESAEAASLQMSQILERQIEDMQKRITKLRRLREELASTITIIRECRSCDDQRFPLQCSDCEVLSRRDLPRAVRLLWT
jgi:DNA-binding transcriptional MerR regulator